MFILRCTDTTSEGFILTACCICSDNCFLQRMDVLRQDVEAMEKEMEELRAYLAKTDENREDEEHTLKDDINYQEAGKNTIRPSAAGH